MVKFFLALCLLLVAAGAADADDFGVNAAGDLMVVPYVDGVRSPSRACEIPDGTLAQKIGKVREGYSTKVLIEYIPGKRTGWGLLPCRRRVITTVYPEQWEYMVETYKKGVR